MQRLPRIRMARRTVGRCRVAVGRAGQGTVICIMTACTGIVRIGCTAYQCIRMAVARTAGGCSHCDARMARIIRMHAIQGSGMTRCTVAARNKVLTNSGAD